MTPSQSWRIRYNDITRKYTARELDKVEFTEALWQLGFRRQEIRAEILFHQPQPIELSGFVSGLAPDTRGYA